jgi:large subunit ribosomal protein L5
MATKEKTNAGAKGAAKGGSKGGKGDKGSSMLPASHKGDKLPVPAPRLRDYYQQTVRAKLAAQFGLTNPMQIPRLEKIVVNVGMGEAIKTPKVLDTVVDELAVITGQKPVRKKAKKSIANFSLRQGQEVGASVTLRGARMWEFMDRFVTTALPRVRDFRGLSTRSFDGRGNYSMGVKEQMIFPEINYDQIEQIWGMDIIVATTAKTDEEARQLLREFQFPFNA